MTQLNCLVRPGERVGAFALNRHINMAVYTIAASRCLFARYLRSSSEAVPVSLFKRMACLFPLTTTLIVPEIPYSLLWKLPR